MHERPRPTANLGTPEAARVIRALLLPANAGKRWTQRSVQERSLAQWRARTGGGGSLAGTTPET